MRSHSSHTYCDCAMICLCVALLCFRLFWILVRAVIVLFISWATLLPKWAHLLNADTSSHRTHRMECYNCRCIISIDIFTADMHIFIMLTHDQWNLFDPRQWWRCIQPIVESKSVYIVQQNQIIHTHTKRKGLLVLSIVQLQMRLILFTSPCSSQSNKLIECAA